MVLDAEHISVERLGRTVLSDVSLRIAAGDCVSVVGPNGAGKSTLMAALLGLVPVRSGRVRLDGEPIGRLARRAIARRVAYVPQIHDGYLGFSVRDVVASGRYPHLEALAPPGEADRAAVERAVDLCRIGDLLDRHLDTLSGGERQKVWIAAALAQETPALFLDEPTSALDPAHQAELIHIMHRFAGEGGTLLVICHDLNLALALGGRVIGLNQGKLAFDAPVEVLLEPERLHALFGTSFELHRAVVGDGRSIQLRLGGEAR
jgi:iron complex transport system ATP-binding protein